MDELQLKYDMLFEEFTCLTKEYDILKFETSENTIIQSMNDMKLTNEYLREKLDYYKNENKMLYENNIVIIRILNSIIKRQDSISTIKQKLRFAQEIIELDKNSFTY